MDYKGEIFIADGTWSLFALDWLVDSGSVSAMGQCRSLGFTKVVHKYLVLTKTTMLTECNVASPTVENIRSTRTIGGRKATPILRGIGRWEVIVRQATPQPP